MYLNRGEIKQLVVGWTGMLVEFHHSYNDFECLNSYSSHLELQLSVYSAVQTRHNIPTIRTTWNNALYSSGLETWTWQLDLSLQNLQESFFLVLATGPGNLPAVWVWTSKTDYLGSRPIQNPDQLPLGRLNLDLYPSTRGFCQVSLDPSVPITGFSFWVSILIVTFRSATVDGKISTLACYYVFLMYSPP